MPLHDILIEETTAYTYRKTTAYTYRTTNILIPKFLQVYFYKYILP